MKNANFERVKAAADLEVVVRHLAPDADLKPAGPRWRGLCPFHGEKTPSFFVQGDRFKCYGCERGGDVFDFVTEMQRCTPPEALQFLAALFKVQIEDHPGKATKTPFQPHRAKTPPDIPAAGKNAVQAKPGPFLPRFLDPVQQVAPTLAEGMRKGNNLFRFLSRLYGEPAVARVFDLYRVGVERERVVFWHIDIEGRVRSGQKIPYPADGHHRIKDAKYPVLTVGPPGGIDPCFFGEHLLGVFPAAVVHIVEGAKTALVCALEDPGGIWIATGGKSNLGEGDVRKWEALKGRNVVLHPDLDKPPPDGSPPPPSPWKLALPRLQSAGFAVTMGTAAERLATAEQRANGGDLADLFLARRERAALIPAEPVVPPQITPPINPVTVKDAAERLATAAARYSLPPEMETTRLWIDYFRDIGNGWETSPKWVKRWGILWELLGEAFPFEGEN